MKKPIENICRVRVLADPFEGHIEPTNQSVHLSPRTTGVRGLLRGVPGHLADVVITGDVLSPKDPRDQLVLEIGLKSGKYDGAERVRFLLRRQVSHQVQQLPLVAAQVVVDDATVTVIAGAESHTFDRLRSELDESCPARIIMWHWRKYYRHLKDNEVAVREMADSWQPSEGASLALANQEASRTLYSLSRELGWAKLTLRERAKLGRPDAGQWQRVEDVERWRELRSVSEYSLEASTGPEKTLTAAQAILLGEAWT